MRPDGRDLLERRPILLNVGELFEYYCWRYNLVIVGYI